MADPRDVKSIQLTRLACTFLLLLLAAACHERADERTLPEDPVLRNYLPEGSPTRDSARLGGLDVWAFCQSRGYPAVGYRLGYIQGLRAAYDNWVCQRGTEQLAPVDSMVVDIVAACAWEYRCEDVTARPDDPDHAWSWHCYPGGG